MMSDVICSETNKIVKTQILISEIVVSFCNNIITVVSTIQLPLLKQQSSTNLYLADVRWVKSSSI